MITFIPALKVHSACSSPSTRRAAAKAAATATETATAVRTASAEVITTGIPIAEAPVRTIVGAQTADARRWSGEPQQECNKARACCVDKRVQRQRRNHTRSRSSLPLSSAASLAVF